MRTTAWTFFLAIATCLFALPYRGVGNDEQLAQLQAQLLEENNRRDLLQKQLEQVKPGLEQAQKQLKELQGNRARPTQIASLKERVEVMETAKMRILRSLLDVQEQRAELLGRLQRLTRQRLENAARTPEERLAMQREQDTAIREAEQRSRKRELNLSLFRKEIESLVKEQRALQARNRETLQRKLSAERMLAKAKLFGNEGEVATHRKEFERWASTQEETRKELQSVRRKLTVMKQEFQRYVAEETNDDVILPGETLELYLAEDRDLNGLYPVRRGGYIIIPKVGRIELAGMDLADAEAAVKRALEETILRKATVLLERPEGASTYAASLDAEENGERVIYLTGAVKNPGPWSVPEGFQPTLVTTIIRSGGAAPNADLQHVRVMRVLGGKELNEVINVQEVLQGRNVASDIELRSEDIIIVPKKKEEPQKIVFVTGLVKEPGPQKLNQEKDLTAHTAILQAGGFAESANMNKVFILRRHGSGRKIHIPVDIRRIRRGQTRDPKLRPDDILVIPGGLFGNSY